MIPLFKENTENDGFDSLERKMVRTMALHRELKRLLNAEYEAGKTHNPKALSRLLLRKTNCVNRFGHLVGSINDQLRRMADKDLPRTCPRTLANRVRALPGLTPEIESTLIPLARALEAEHRALVGAARRNGALFKGIMDRMWAASRYRQQGGPS